MLWISYKEKFWIIIICINLCLRKTNANLLLRNFVCFFFFFEHNIILSFLISFSFLQTLPYTSLFFFSKSWPLFPLIMFHAYLCVYTYLCLNFTCSCHVMLLICTFSVLFGMGHPMVCTSLAKANSPTLSISFVTSRFLVWKVET